MCRHLQCVSVNVSACVIHEGITQALTLTQSQWEDLTGCSPVTQTSLFGPGADYSTCFDLLNHCCFHDPAFSSTLPLPLTPEWSQTHTDCTLGGRISEEIHHRQVLILQSVMKMSDETVKTSRFQEMK